MIKSILLCSLQYFAPSIMSNYRNSDYGISGEESTIHIYIGQNSIHFQD